MFDNIIVYNKFGLQTRNVSNSSGIVYNFFYNQNFQFKLDS